MIVFSPDGGNFTTGNGISITNTSSMEPASPNNISIPTISLPRSVFERINGTNNTGLVFTLYGESTLFPVRNSTNNSATMTVVGSRIIAASVAQRNTTFEDLPEPIIVLLPLEIGDEVSVECSNMHPSSTCSQRIHEMLLCIICVGYPYAWFRSMCIVGL